MKYAWWVIFFLSIFLFCTQRVAAVEISGFDPTSPYVVHSVPLIVSEPFVPVLAPTVAPMPGTIADTSVTVESQTEVQTVTDISYDNQKTYESFFTKMGKELSSLVSKIKAAM
ncbi:MAG: hypothetical protein ABI425_00805 [Patescibacteria group bacterium]